MAFFFEEAVFQRHGHAEPGTDDMFRPLSSIGREQAREMSKIFSAGPPRLLLTSPAKRAEETARITTEALKNRIVCEPALYEAPNRPLDRKLHELLMKLRHRPLHEYFEDPEGHVLREYGALAAGQILRIAHEKFLPPTLYVAGHSVTLPALIHDLYGDSRAVQEFALSHVFDECEAIRITRVGESYTIQSIKP